MLVSCTLCEAGAVTHLAPIVGLGNDQYWKRVVEDQSPKSNVDTVSRDHPDDRRNEEVRKRSYGRPEELLFAINPTPWLEALDERSSGRDLHLYFHVVHV